MVKRMRDLNTEEINFITIAEHHKKYCKRKDCSISLILLRLTGEKAGLVFTDKEKEVFI